LSPAPTNRRSAFYFGPAFPKTAIANCPRFSVRGSKIADAIPSTIFSLFVSKIVDKHVTRCRITLVKNEL